MSSRLEQLERLVQLKDAGALTAEEFAAEKAKILDVQDMATKENARPSEDLPASPDDSAEEVSWNPFKRPADVAVAERLSRFGLLAGSLMVICDLAGLANLAFKGMTGAVYEDGTTYVSILPIVGGVLFAVFALDVGLTFASWRGRSRWAAIGLLAMSMIAALGSLLELFDGRTLWRLLQLVMNWGAFFCAIQAVRGAVWMRAMGGLPNLRDKRADSEREMARTLDAYMPAAARRRWLIIGGGVAAVVLAVWVGSNLTNQANRLINEGSSTQEVATATATATATAPADLMPAPSAPTSEAPILALPTLVSGIPFAKARQQLIAAGLSPMPIKLNGECPGGLCQAYPEVMECVGMGSSPDSAVYAPCTLRYRRDADGAWVIVRTTGEFLPEYNQDVDFHDMAVMNVEDQGTVGEMEAQYASLATN